MSALRPSVAVVAGLAAAVLAGTSYGSASHKVSADPAAFLRQEREFVGEMSVPRRRSQKKRRREARRRGR